DRAVGIAQIQIEGQLEARRNTVRRRLGLPGRDGKNSAVPDDVHVELGVAGFVQPLLEEAPEAATADLLHGQLQIPRLDESARVPLQIEAHAAPEERAPDLDA